MQMKHSTSKMSTIVAALLMLLPAVAASSDVPEQASDTTPSWQFAGSSCRGCIGGDCTLAGGNAGGKGLGGAVGMGGGYGGGDGEMRSVVVVKLTHGSK